MSHAGDWLDSCSVSTTHTMNVIFSRLTAVMTVLQSSRLIASGDSSHLHLLHGECLRSRGGRLILSGLQALRCADHSENSEMVAYLNMLSLRNSHIQLWVKVIVNGVVLWTESVAVVLQVCLLKFQITLLGKLLRLLTSV